MNIKKGYNINNINVSKEVYDCLVQITRDIKKHKGNEKPLVTLFHNNIFIRIYSKSSNSNHNMIIVKDGKSLLCTAEYDYSTKSYIRIIENYLDLINE